MRISAGCHRGQAAVELLAIVPLVLATLLAVAQLAVAGYALWAAADAARAGARAAHVGGDAESAARGALPGFLEEAARIDSADAVEVSVGAPGLLPGIPDLRVGASSQLDPAAADG